MTILPKKKQNSSKDSRPNNSNEHSEAHSSHQDGVGAVAGGVASRGVGATGFNENSASASNLRRPLSAHHHSSVGDPDGALLNGPHRKRVAGAVGSGHGNNGASSTSSSSRQDRSSPHRSVRKTRATVGVSSRLSPGPENEPDGAACNSDDEYERSAKGVEFSDELERKFEEKLVKTKGYSIKKMKDDGACLFRSVADQVYGDQEMHNVVRKLCMDYMVKNSDHFSQFVTEDFNMYIARKRVETAHGNHVEMQAMAEMFNRPIEVFQYTLEPINTFHNTSSKTDMTPIRVSYHRNVHYNSLVDPYAATIGVGLGLPQFYPGLAEKNLMRDAMHDSEQHEIEHAMLKDKLMATDWEATDEELQEQIARESYLEWMRNQEKVMKEQASGSRGESTVTRPNKPRSPNAQLSPVQQQAGAARSKSVSPPHASDYNFAGSNEAGPSHRVPLALETASLMNNLSPSLFGLNRWDDDGDIMSQVLALSQQEYLDMLKQQVESSSTPSSSSSS